MGSTWVNLLASVIDWILRVAGCGALVVLAFFLTRWWFG